MTGKARPTQDVISFGEFRLRVSERVLEKQDTAVPIGSRAFDLLVVLAQNAGQVVSKQSLMASAWPDLVVEESNLRFQISQLRRILEVSETGARYVMNIPGRGYSFVAAIAQPDSGEPAAPLPPPLARMVGRRTAITGLLDRLQTSRFVTIVGHGGIGKTTVAVAAAHEFSAATDTPVTFVDLGNARDAAMVHGLLADALGVPLHPDNPIAGLIGAFTDTAMLLCLDCCEQVVDAVAEVTEALFAARSDLRILTTSREPLRAEGEHVLDLPPLEVPQNAGLLATAEVLAIPAAALFVERARASGYDRPITAADAAVIARICERLDGIPLAIEFAAARAATHGLGPLETLLDGRLQLLWQGRRTATPRHQTLMATLDWSHALTSDMEQDVLRRLSVLVGPFSMDAAVAIASDSAIRAPDVIAAVEGLVTKSMILAIPTKAGATEFRLLDITRAYACEKLKDDAACDATKARHAAYVETVLTDIYADTSLTRKKRRRRLHPMVGNLRAALEHRFGSGDNPTGRQTLARTGTMVFLELSYLEECRNWAEAALSAQTPTTRGGEDEIALQATLGHALMFTRGNSAAARAALERSLTLAKGAQMYEHQFRTLVHLHTLHRRTCEYNLLQPIVDQAAALCERLDDPYLPSAMHVFSGVTFQLTGRIGPAIHHTTAALSGPWQQHRAGPGHFSYVGMVQMVRALSLWLGGRFSDAAALSDTLVAAPERQDVAMYCAGLSHAAIVFHGLGKTARLDATIAQLIQSAGRNGLAPYVAVGNGFRGVRLIETGQTAQGCDILRDVIATLHSYRYALYAGQFMRPLAIASAKDGAFAGALDLIAQPLEFAQQHQSFEVAEFLRTRAIILARKGDGAAADAAFQAAFDTTLQQDAKGLALKAAISWVQHAPQATAIAALKQGLGQLADDDSSADLARARACLSGH